MYKRQRQGYKVATRIENMLKTKQYLKIIETKTKNDKLINIGDVLKVKIYYLNKDVEEAL